MVDFGLAITHIQVIDFGINPRVGTKRYMAAEILDER